MSSFDHIRAMMLRDYATLSSALFNVKYDVLKGLTPTDFMVSMGFSFDELREHSPKTVEKFSDVDLSPPGSWLKVSKITIGPPDMPRVEFNFSTASDRLGTILATFNTSPFKATMKVSLGEVRTALLQAATTSTVVRFTFKDI